MRQKDAATQESSIRWWDVFRISIACYVPALIIVVVSFFLFRNTSISSQSNQTNQLLTEEQRNQITEEVKKALKRQPEEVEEALALQRAISEVPISIVAKEYIDGQVRQESEEQVKQVEDEVNNLKENWKGDLFGQIAFPVVFAIASIFAAFAVKDILTEILKEQERDRIKQELKQELRNQIVPEAIERDEINERVEAVEICTYWIEYELMTLSINQLIDEIKETSSSSQKIEDNVLSAIDNFFNRANLVLDKVSSNVREKELELIRRSKSEILSTKLRSIGLDDKVQALIKKTNEKLQTTGREKDKLESGPESKFVRLENILQVQMRLLLTTLNRLQEKSDSNEIVNLTDEVEKWVAIDWKIRYEENKNRARQSRNVSSIKPPFQRD